MFWIRLGLPYILMCGSPNEFNSLMNIRKVDFIFGSFEIFVLCKKIEACMLKIFVKTVRFLA